MSAAGDASSVGDRPSSAVRQVWLVFARRKYDEPIYQVGTVTADRPEMAEVYARSIYDEHPWIEMMVVPRDATRRVIAP